MAGKNWCFSKYVYFSMGTHYTNSRRLGAFLEWAMLIGERCPQDEGLLQICELSIY